jgi:16S rRNA (cytidine1402-2'-O)-methyltransferase
MAPFGDPEPNAPDHSSTETLSPGLYITATPIGNARDITIRALSVLRNCDVIVAEDTRVTARLLSIYGISRPLLIYNDHNAATATPKLLRRLREGQRLAFVSDAGTPLISDPGYRLVKAARDEGLPVVPIPGPSAIIAALSAAGISVDRFFFAGFLPARGGERRGALKRFQSLPATLVFLESAQRLPESLADMAEVLGDRNAVVAREITKLHEEMRRGSLQQLAAHYVAVPAKGEIVILAGPAAEPQGPDLSLIDSLLRQALLFMPVKAAAALVAEATGGRRRDIYARALVLVGQDRGSSE